MYTQAFIILILIGLAAGILFYTGIKLLHWNMIALQWIKNKIT